MKITKLAIVFIFISTLALGVSAQSKRYKNEIEGYRFFESEKLNSLTVAKSTEEDVVKIFGSNCESSCDYDADWEITFMYVRNIEVIVGSVGKSMLRVNPKMIGKVMLIRLKPKNNVSFADHKFSRKFKKITGKLERKRNNQDTTLYFDSFVDRKGLTYVIFDEYLEDGVNEENEKGYEEGDLISVEYRLSDKQARKMFVRQK